MHKNGLKTLHYSFNIFLVGPTEIMRHHRYLKMANYQLRNRNVVLVNDLAVHLQPPLVQVGNPKSNQENTGIPHPPPVRIRGRNVEKRRLL